MAGKNVDDKLRCSFCNKTQNQIIDYFNVTYNKVTVKGAAACRVFFHLKAEAVRMGEKMV